MAGFGCSPRVFVGACGNLIETVERGLADRWRHVHMQQGWGEERREDPDLLFGNNGLYRRDALIDAGLYDESCRTNGEDATMARNLYRNGCRLVYDPGARCDHLREDSIRSICRTFWNYHFYDHPERNLRFVLRARRRARRILLKRFRSQDLSNRRFDLALLDTWMCLEWQLHAWRDFLGSRSSRSNTPGIRVATERDLRGGSPRRDAS